MRFHTLKTQFTLSIWGFFVLVLIVAVAGMAGVSEVRRNADTADRTWLAGTRMLGEIGGELSRFRLAETVRALSPTPSAVDAAEADAATHGAAINSLMQHYETLAGPLGARNGLAEFATAWFQYRAAHDAWIQHDVTFAQAEAALPRSALDAAFVAADAALGRLAEANRLAARTQTVATDDAADRAMKAVSLLAFGAALFAVLLIGRVGYQLTRPLATITSALSRLAAGSRDVRIPELDRADEIGQMAKAFEVFRANARALEEAQQLANALARHDALTGLPNRRLFAAEFESALAEVRAGASACAVMLVDLDRFKPVNDLHGHAAGDTVLCEIARRLEEVAGKAATVARLGGDEFALIAPTPADPKQWAEAAARLAKRIVGAIREPVRLPDSRVEVGASIGIAICPADGLDADTLLRAADLAMYRAKQNGRGTFCFFEQSMDQDLRDRAAFEADLRAALQAGQILPFYQPLMDMDSTRLHGFEVLARWQHPVRGAVSPDVFIPLAEQLGLMGDLTGRILRQACRDARGWDPAVRLALNVSPAQFQDPALPTTVMAILMQEGFAPTRLEIEVTESALVGDLEAAKFTLQALQDAGIKVALDDFGTGYSSLYHLRELRFDKLKIDRSFVQSMLDNPESEKIVDAVLGLARSLGMPAVAEGIETAETMRRLAERGCEYGQGYLFSKAIPATSATALVENLRAPARLAG